VIEYIHLKENQDFKYLNTSLFCMSLDFIYHNNFMLPFHCVKKNVNIFLEKEVKSILLWKSEKFIFDILPYSKNINVICFPKKDCYAPLKNYEGKDSIKDVQEALYQKDRSILFEITDQKIDSKIFELSQDFHYPSDELKKKWEHHSFFTSSYIDS
jgi:UDP-N-acetylglucosamine/UDP-N-acetylgalactosamine diphosphorylase